MNQRKLFYSKKFFVFNLILVGVIVGFVFSFIIFGTSSHMKIGEEALAQEAPFPQNNGSAGIATAESLQNSFRNVAKDVLPVVVELKVIEVVKQQVPQGQGWPWDFLFPEQDNNGDKQQQEREFRSQGLGSGVIVRKDGDKYYVLTNNHVVGEADEIKAVLNDNREYTASLVGKDPRKDLAMVMFETKDGDIPVARLGDSDAMQVGDWVLAVGSPFGFVSSVTAGIISAKGRSGPEGNISDFIQTDAAINRGNSGGALVDIYGNVIGINTWIAAPTGGSVGLGFAIPINNAKGAIEDFISKGEVEYGWLGVSVGDMTKEFADALGLDELKGAFVHNIYMDSPADKGGMRPGDFITRINGRRVESRDEVVRVVGDLEAGERAEFEVIRFGRSMNLTVKIGKRADSEKILSNQNKLWPGMTVVPLEEEAKKQMEIDASTEGVLVLNVEKGTKAFIHGLRAYDIILSINGTDIKSMEDFYRIMGDPDLDKFEVIYLRDGEKGYAGIVR
jgi:Do/DeqQ family serine protease